MKYTWANKRANTIILFSACVVVFFMSACKPRPKITTFPFSNYVNWNVSVRPGASDDEKKRSLDSVINFIREFKLTDRLLKIMEEENGRKLHISLKTDSIKVYTCPCDPDLINITANLIVIDSSGDTTLKPPPPPQTPPIILTPPTPNPPTFGSEIGMDTIVQSIRQGVRIKGFPGTISKNRILAIMDTGLDTTLFDPQIRSMIWQEPVRGNTLYNFLPGEDPKVLLDDNSSKHGSAATAIALSQVTIQSPRIMVLKVLDAHGHGSVFSVSCGLAYARKNNASVINASLGYYGAKDPVFTKYFTKIYDSTVIVAAAGNDTSEHHDNNKLCYQPVKSSNELTSLHMFFPACFSKSTADLISVTGLTGNKDSIWPCYYQNYSGEYVTMGVLKNDTGCCTMNVPFLEYPVEGSSFVAPVVSGKIVNYMIQNGFRPATQLYLQGIGVNNAAPVKYTVNGQYIKN
ncbi:S8/S53 family peptidase [Pinibacter soli]|uniref:S8/S53 family peptidase n=1 Tax=Pinibacter soli TaxID=3044211 RepID=A0ABT6R9D9_9BACT|nr:S8/S53 family peptidase [Pinibacter soli]MDI3319165.1 S8/S53 family peptidase [Pinibacter soli]